MISRCPSCGSQVNGDDASCQDCGWDFSSKNQSIPEMSLSLAESQLSSPAELPPSSVSEDSPKLVIAPIIDDSGVVFKISPAPPAPVSDQLGPGAEKPPVEAAVTSKHFAPEPVVPPDQRRGKPTVSAAIIGAILSIAGIAAIALFTHNETPSLPLSVVTADATAEALDRPTEKARPTANFGTPMHVVVARINPSSAQSKTAAPTAQSTQDSKTSVKLKHSASKHLWRFEGTIFDLRTNRGIYGVRVEFIGSSGQSVGFVDSGSNGRYRFSLPALAPGAGYRVRLSHPDYRRRWIDQGDATSALREASIEDRKKLYQAASRASRWIGDTNKTVKRDVAMIPNTTD